MAEVEIYTTSLCGFCHRAKSILQNKGVEFIEHDVTFKPDQRQEMSKRAGGKTSVPQIFIDGRGIGGCDELIELDIDDELDPLLGLAG